MLTQGKWEGQGGVLKYSLDVCSDKLNHSTLGKSMGKQEPLFGDPCWTSFISLASALALEGVDGR